MILGRDAVEGYTWLENPVIQSVPPPERVFYDQRDQEAIAHHEAGQRRVGFAPPLPKVVDPLLWEGDGA